MTDRITAGVPHRVTTGVPHSLVGEYEALLKKLQLLDRKLLQRGSTKNAVFINNMILRLKVWAADIDVAGGALDSAEKIGPLATQIGLRLADLKAQCDSFRHAPDKAGAELTDYKHDFTQSMDSLSTFSEPLKTVRTSTMNETGSIAKINTHLRESSFYPNTPRGWHLLREPLANRRGMFLLGSVVADADWPTHRYIPSEDHIMPENTVSHITTKDFSLQAGSSKARSVGLTSSLLGSYIPLSQYRYARGNSSYEATAPEIRTSTLINEERLFHDFLQDYNSEITKLLTNAKERKAFWVVGIMSTSNLAMDFQKSVSRGVQIEIPELKIPERKPYKQEIPRTISNPQTGISKDTTKESSATDNSEQDLVFAVRYRVVKVKRFSGSIHLGELRESKGYTKGIMW